MPQLSSLLRYVDTNEAVKTRFLKAEELECTDAEHIFYSVKLAAQSVQTHGLNMVGLASDGASVMTGVYKGVATRFKKENAHLITTHCMAHRLQLASQKAADQVPYLVKYIAVINQFAKSLKFSPKLQRILQASKELSVEKSRKIRQIFFTRWLSLNDTVQAIAGCIGSVLACLAAGAQERDVYGRAMLHGLMNQIGDIRFLMMTFFLADVVGVLASLSLIMQKQDVQYQTIKSHLDGACDVLQAYKEKPGEKLQQLHNVIPQIPDGTGYVEYKGQSYKDSEKKRKTFSTSSQQYLDALIEKLNMSFPDHDLLAAFQVLSPVSSLSMDKDEQLEKLNVLLEHYGGTVDREAALREWQLLLHIFKNFKGHNLEKFMKDFLHESRETFPNLSQLSALGLCVPVTSVTCERGVSTYNAIKTDSRNALKVENANMFMLLNLEAPGIEDFNFDRAFEVWTMAKNRRAAKLLQ